MSEGRQTANQDLGSWPEEPLTPLTQRSMERSGAPGQRPDSEVVTELRLLAASMSHEIRNSLAGVRGAVEVLQGGYAERSEQGQIFREILRRLDGVNAIAGDLLEYTRPLIAKMEVLHLLESLDAVLSSLSIDPRLQCITIVKEYRYDPVLKADRNLLERLFLNLILNAAQAMKFSGELKIRVAESSKTVSISFIDKGCGMDRGIQEKIFGPFFTTKAAGTGLGLFLCKKYVEAHNGKIEVKTEPGLGSTFTVLLPGTPSTLTGHQRR